MLGVFLCDGIVDCDDGFDESTTLCGENDDHIYCAKLVEAWKVYK